MHDTASAQGRERASGRCDLLLLFLVFEADEVFAAHRAQERFLVLSLLQPYSKAGSQTI